MNLFLVMTSLQLINAIEAKNYYGISKDEATLLVIYPKNRETIIRSIIKEKDWGRVEYFEREEEKLIRKKSTTRIGRFISWFIACVSFLRLIKQLRNEYSIVDRLFIANYIQETNIHTANALSPKKVILLDDGNASIGIAELRHGDLQVYQTDRFSLQGKIRIMIKKILGYKLRNIPAVTFFSTYDLSVGPNDTLVQNSYSHIKATISGISKTEKIYFIGGSLVENKIVSYYDFTVLVGKVIEYFDGADIVYVKHPGEHLDEVEVMLKENGFEVVSFSAPIELSLLRFEKLPKIVASFISSSMITINSIFEGMIELNVFQIPIDLITDNRQEWASGVYEYFNNISTSSFKIIPLHGQLNRITSN